MVMMVMIMMVVVMVMITMSNDLCHRVITMVMLMLMMVVVMVMVTISSDLCHRPPSRSNPSAGQGGLTRDCEDNGDFMMITMMRIRKMVHDEDKDNGS